MLLRIPVKTRRLVKAERTTDERRRRIKDLFDVWIAVVSFVVFLAVVGGLIHAGFKLLKL